MSRKLCIFAVHNALNLKKIIKIFSISIVSILALLFLLPLLLPETINKEITKAINKNIKGQVHFESTRISFFSHFPALTLDLRGFLLKGSAPFENDTLVAAKQLSLGINLPSLLSQKIKIDEFFLDDAKINVQTDSLGHSNYNVFESSGEQKTATSEKETQLKIEGIYISNADVTYNDLTIPFLVHARNLNYIGTGDLTHAIFDLKSKLSITGIDLFYDNTAYLSNKKLNAKLVTKINTNSLELLFDENDLKINSLPIAFKGKFSFVKDGYDMSFYSKAKETDLRDIFSALPAMVTDRIEGTKIDGYAEINASLVGKYVVSENLMPTLSFNMKIRDGKIKNPAVPEPISNLYLNVESALPGLNPDSLKLVVDSLYFNIGKDYVASVTKVRGLNNPDIYTNTRTDMDLEKWAKVVNLDSLQLKGRLKMNLKLDGSFAKKVVRHGIRQVDTVLSRVPVFSFNADMKGGYFKYPKMPIPVDNIAFNIQGHNQDGKPEHTYFGIDHIDIRAQANYIKGSGTYQAGTKAPIDVKLQSVLNLGDLKNIYPVQGLELRGIVNTDITSKGTYDKRRKHFPVTRAVVKMDNGYVRTDNFDQPLENILVDADLTNTNGTLRDTKLNIRPIAFSMGGQPFSLSADIKDLENVRYHVISKGTLDVGKIYKLFAIKGYQLKGSINTNVDLAGLQSDAIARRINRLRNRGRIEVKELNFRSDLFPKEFLIKHGVFTFRQDKMNFNRFVANYGQSDFTLNGNLANVVNYALSSKANLEGNFTMNSRRINANEFMVFGEPATSNSKPSASNGVIVIPPNLKVGFKANVNKVLYNGLDILDAKGQMTLDKGALSLEKTGFTLAGAKVLMDARYQNKGLRAALFSFHLNADNFDIARAYKEVKLFRDMASSASKVKGVVGLDYQLTGRLNSAMYPVMPSIQGEGQLTLHQVSLMGFKMMNAVSKETKRTNIKDPKLKDVVIKSTIKNNILTIERTKMRIAGFRPRFEGQVSLDGRLNLSGRLGLPPFGIFGIPLSITGTQVNPVVKLKRNKEGKLDETEDKEEDSK